MALQFESLAKIVSDGFSGAAVTTSAGLKDDEFVRTAARNIYDVIPFPVNMAVKMSIGVEGLERFALAFRDQLIAAGVTDLENVRTEDYLRYLRNGLAAVPGLSKFVSIPLAAESMSNVAPSPPGASTSSPPRAWYLWSAGQQHGPWTDAMFLENLHSGKLSATDKVWLDGLRDWIDLRSLPDYYQSSVQRCGDALPTQ